MRGMTKLLGALVVGGLLAACGSSATNEGTLDGDLLPDGGLPVHEGGARDGSAGFDGGITLPGDGSVPLIDTGVISFDAPTGHDGKAPGKEAGADGAFEAGGGDTGQPNHDGGHEGGSNEAGADGATGDATADVVTVDTGITGLLVGENCTQDSDCASELCKPVLLNTTQRVCVTPCTSELDCGAGSGFFCDPITAGNANGYCVPNSPAHCLSCTQNSDCGSLSEVCAIGPGDNALACHVDCSLAGASACPSDYSCVSTTANGVARQLCVPNSPSTCLDANGGYCDRVSLPQSCARSNMDGTCVGTRTCDMAAGRFTSCGATAPQCKTDCSVDDPAGCTEDFCASAVDTPSNCGTCGNSCPGYQEQNDVVACVGTPVACTFACEGENYDVDGDPSNGCEVVANPAGNHTDETAISMGSFGCSDGSSAYSRAGNLPSDARVHESPAITGFNAGEGSAPVVYSVYGSGGDFCDNDVIATLTVTSSMPSCYEFTVTTSSTTFNCRPGDGTVTNGGQPVPNQCEINPNDNDGSYGGDTTLYFTITKTCPASFDENATFSFSGHL